MPSNSTTEVGPRSSPNDELLLRPDPTLGVPLPAYEGRSLANVAGSIWRSVGPDDSARAPPLPTLVSALDPWAGERATGPVVLLLLDGLGWNAFQGAARRSPDGVAGRWSTLAKPLTSVFPTTTAVVLTSVSSGAAPGQHGVVGHRVYLPRFGTVAEVLRMSPLGVSPAETLVAADWTPSIVSGVPTIFRQGVVGSALSRDRFQGSGFTRMIYDGATFVPYATGSDLALGLAELLSRTPPPPLVLAYREDLDVLQHIRGTRPELVDLELERAGSLVSFVAAHVPQAVARQTRVLVTGDHGQVPLDPRFQISADREPELLGHLLRPPSGDRRATFLAARPGHHEALYRWLSSRVPEGGHLLETPRAVERGLFGPPPHHPELSDRLGDFLLLLPSPGGVSYIPPGSPPRGQPMLAAHGGLEPDELLVPFVCGSFSELGSSSAPSANRPPASSRTERR